MAAPPPPAETAPLSAREVQLAGALGLAILIVYLPALTGGFLWDDDHHVTPAALSSWVGLIRIWLVPGTTEQYYPLLHTAFWVEHRLWGDVSLGYHLVNLVLHATNACLFAALLRRLAIPGAWLAAAMFALHPVCVESVAWITEQKNTLSTCFYLCSALAYLRFDADRRPSLYALATSLFVLALLSKTFTATMPAAILVVLWWKRGRLEWTRDVRPLLPWFVASALASILTTAVERHDIGGLGAHFELTAIQRLALAGRDVAFYLGKLLWPTGLSFIYPRWTINPMAATQWLPFLGVLLLTGVLWSRRRRGRGPLAALLFFVGSLFPVLGFFDVFVFIYSFVADHFDYLPSLGVFAAVGAVMASALHRTSGVLRQLGNAAVAVVLVGLGILTWKQSRNYRDYETLFRATLEQNPDCWMAHNNLGSALLYEGKVDEAVVHFEEAVRLNPDNPLFHNNLGGALLKTGRLAEAVVQCQAAVQLWPNFANAHFNLGLALAQTGHVPEAIHEFQQAVAISIRT